MGTPTMGRSPIINSSLIISKSNTTKYLLEEQKTREVATERETELGRLKTKINELEANQSQSKDTIKHKDLEIEALEDAN